MVFNGPLKKFSLNMLGYGYSQVVTLAIQLLLVPFFIKNWDIQLYSEWLILTGIPVFLTILDLGVAQATASRATMFASAGRVEEARISLQTSFLFSILIFFFLFLLSFFLIDKVSWDDILNLSIINNKNASTIFFLMSVYLGVNILGGPLDAWFRATDRAALGAFLLANRRMVDVIITVFIVSLGGQPLELAYGMLTGQIVIFFLILYFAQRGTTWPILGLKFASMNEFKIALVPGLYFMAFPMVQMVTLQGGMQILNQISTSQIVVTFSMGRALMRLILQVAMISNQALRPEVSKLLGRGEVKNAKAYVKKLSFFVLFIALVAYAVLVSIGPLIIDWWSHGKVYVSSVDLVIIGLHALLYSSWFIHASLEMAENKHSRLSSFYIMGAVCGFLLWRLMGDLVKPIYGASFVLAFPEFIMFIYMMYVRKLFSDNKIQIK